MPYFFYFRSKHTSYQDSVDIVTSVREEPTGQSPTGQEAVPFALESPTPPEWVYVYDDLMWCTN
jgi:hypothetical protein